MGAKCTGRKTYKSKRITSQKVFIFFIERAYTKNVYISNNKYLFIHLLYIYIYIYIYSERKRIWTEKLTLLITNCRMINFFLI